jgi:hypothetical protein
MKELYRKFNEGTRKYAPLNNYLGTAPNDRLNLQDIAKIVMDELMAMKENFAAHWKDGILYGVTNPNWEWEVRSPYLVGGAFIDCRQAVGMSPGILDDICELLDLWKIEEETVISGENLVWDSSFEQVYHEPGEIVYAEVEDTPGFVDRFEVSPFYSFFTVPESILTNGSKYFWNVKGYTATGSLSSDTWEFTVWTEGPEETPLLEIKPQSKGSVQVVGRQLLVDGQPYQIKGVGYNPVPIGEVHWSMADTRLYERDFQELKDMNCNTIRTWRKVNETLLNYADIHDLKVCAGFWVNTDLDFANPTVRNSVLLDFKKYVYKFKDHPALLLWAIGNENNLHNGDNPEWYSLVNEMAKAAYSIEGESYHPVAIVNGDMGNKGDITDDNIGSTTKGADDESLDYVDIWAENFYPPVWQNGPYPSGDYIEYVNKTTGPFANTFESYKALTDKPLWISEYGVDAYDNNASGQYQFVQSQCVQHCWNQINANWSGSDPDNNVCLGATLMAYSDEWNKAGIPAEHGTGGSDWGDRQPDGYSNEEWYGIMEVALDGTWETSPTDGIDDIQPRSYIYNALQSLWQ